jgi:hypothetical protein
MTANTPSSPLPAAQRLAQRRQQYHLLRAIVLRRDEQDRRWGGPAPDETHTASHWLDLIRSSAAVAVPETQAASSSSPLDQQFIDIAALAVAALESLARRREERHSHIDTSSQTAFERSPITAAHFAALRREYSTLWEQLDYGRQRLPGLQNSRRALQVERDALYLLAASAHRTLPPEPPRQATYPPQYSLEPEPLDALIGDPLPQREHAPVPACPQDPAELPTAFGSIASEIATLWWQRSVLLRDLNYFSDEVSYLNAVVHTLRTALRGDAAGPAELAPNAQPGRNRP